MDRAVVACAPGDVWQVIESELEEQRGVLDAKQAKMEALEAALQEQTAKPQEQTARPWYTSVHPALNTSLLGRSKPAVTHDGAMAPLCQHAPTPPQRHQVFGLSAAHFSVRPSTKSSTLR